MHTFTPNDRISIHYNGGFDGDIIFTDKEKGVEVMVDSEDLLNFVAHCYVEFNVEDLLQDVNSKTLVMLVPIIQKILREKGGS